MRDTPLPKISLTATQDGFFERLSQKREKYAEMLEDPSMKGVKTAWLRNTPSRRILFTNCSRVPTTAGLKRPDLFLNPLTLCLRITG